MILKNTKQYAIIAIIIAILALGFLYMAGIFSSPKMTAQKFVELQEGKSAHKGFRRAHAKGICITGEFISKGALSEYSTAQVFQEGEVTPFYGRFSIGGGNPTAPDLKSPVRSLALVFQREKNQQWRMAMNTPPVMAVRTPEDFYKQLTALFPNPKTGIRDPQAIGEFFKKHPESAAFLEWKKHYKPTNSFSTERYHSINAFYLVDQKGHKHAVRWSAVPQREPEYTLLENASKDALQNDLVAKLKNNPIHFDLMFSFAKESDLVDDPTQPWPKNRLNIKAGTIVIKASEMQKGGICEGTNFDPLVLPEGMEPSKDPILRARSAAYAESYRRRARETLLESIK